MTTSKIGDIVLINAIDWEIKPRNFLINETKWISENLKVRNDTGKDTTEIVDNYLAVAMEHREHFKDLKNRSDYSVLNEKDCKAVIRMLLAIGVTTDVIKQKKYVK